MTRPGGELAWSLDLDPEEWLVVPLDADESWRADTVGCVRSALVEPASKGGRDDRSSDVRLGEVVVDAVDRLSAFAREMAPDDRVVAALGVPEHTPVPVLVTVAPTVDDVDLLEVCGAEQGRSFDAPEVEHLDLVEGDGVRVTRTDIDSHAVVWMTVSLAARTELVDAVVRWRTTDLSLVPTMTKRLDTLLAAIRIHPRPDRQKP